MTALMAEDTKQTDQADDGPRERLVIDTDPIINRAVELRVLKANLEATMKGARPKKGGKGRSLSKSDVVTEILRQALATEIAELEGEPPAPRPRRK